MRIIRPSRVAGLAAGLLLAGLAVSGAHAHRVLCTLESGARDVSQAVEVSSQNPVAEVGDLSMRVHLTEGRESEVTAVLISSRLDAEWIRYYIKSSDIKNRRWQEFIGPDYLFYRLRCEEPAADGE